MAALHLGEFAEGLVKSGTMILISEIGDKTFFIAAIMAMRNPRGVVFAGAIGALAVMTVLSAALGWAAPNLISKTYTHYLNLHPNPPSPPSWSPLGTRDTCLPTYHPPHMFATQKHVRTHVGAD